MNWWISIDPGELFSTLLVLVFALLLMVVAVLFGWDRFTAIRDRFRYGKPGPRLGP